MRIITGAARGARLQAPAGEHTRPTAERTKEAVFSMLGEGVVGRPVLDLFGGSGQLGLEAVSRGATRAVIVDNDRAAVEVMRENARHTKLFDRVDIISGDAISFLRTYTGAPFGLIFLDPPYATALVYECLALIAARGLLRCGGTVVCETAAPEAVFAGDAALEAQYEVLRRARYGVAHIALLSPVREGQV
ncbi:MAG: methyltransferase domain-containing protein [Ruminococcaceae bacterium]|nr:methyltransferase domain-containing protein [Oscillospiraceae bacterium]